MPTVDKILQNLSHIANHYTAFAILWHILIATFIIALFFKWKPTNRLISTLFSIPFFSVSLFAWMGENPFNGTVFGIVGILLLLFGLRNNQDQIKKGPVWAKTGGVIIIIFGLVYPHFLDVNSIFEYFYSSPLGLIPCPTLSVIIGFACIYSGFHSKNWSLILLIAGLIYAIIGIIRLNVYLDLGLLLADIILAGIIVAPKKKDPNKNN